MKAEIAARKLACRAAVAGRQPEGLVVDLWGSRENAQQAGPGNQKEAKNQHLRPIDHRAGRLAGPLAERPAGSTQVALGAGAAELGAVIAEVPVPIVADLARPTDPTRLPA